MHKLKGIYFYFLAVAINIIKITKKIYFKTNIYNRSLISQIPKQFYFYPNPFLLSSMSTHKNFSFDVSDFDPYIFLEKQDSKKEERNIHNFIWLNLINRKNDSSKIQKIITVWIYKNSNYKDIIWENSVTSLRIISWILNAEIILNNTDNIFRNNFFQSITSQTNHLKKNVKFENNNLKKLQTISAVLLTGLVFEEYSNNYDLGIRELEKLIESFFDQDGFPIDRNPEHLLLFSKFLILIKECIKDSQKYMPDFLDNIIEKNINCLKSVSTPKNQLPLFNGSPEINLDSYFKYIESLNYKAKVNKTKVGNIQIVKYKKNYIYFDVGGPPKKDFSNNYRSGPLSFEYFFDNEKVITNCGFGNNISRKAILLSRLTSAQSTVCLDDTSVVKFERNKILNTAFDNTLKGSFKIFDLNYEDNEKYIGSSASHDAYQENFSYIHRRQIQIQKSNYGLLGCDKLINKNSSKDVKFDIRFHLYPGISAFQTMGGNSILIQIKKNKSLIFTSLEHKLSIEKSIFLGRNKILNNLCIAISGNVKNETQEINWELKKNI